ncbi:MAG: hypothetical protein JRF42_17865 [Deltaproteobacteria bacterium]|nr:hypothetical protein [Deltaproteobacteria bacterium]MBW2720148.1 hypothetical protein [Deltaproteobacteria bacterium]
MPAKAAIILLFSTTSWCGVGMLWGVGVVHAENEDPGDRDALVDTDGDGTDDETERRIGTDPTHNGLIDFPEPMVFDMVRGLGAEQGEVELNTLVLVPTSASAT